MPAHKKDTKHFRELTTAEQARSITAMLNNIQAAIKHHISRAPDQRVAHKKCTAQVVRLLERLQALRRERG